MVALGSRRFLRFPWMATSAWNKTQHLECNMNHESSYIGSWWESLNKQSIISIIHQKKLGSIHNTKKTGLGSSSECFHFLLGLFFTHSKGVFWLNGKSWHRNHRSSIRLYLFHMLSWESTHLGKLHANSYTWIRRISGGFPKKTPFVAISTMFFCYPDRSWPLKKQLHSPETIWGFQLRVLDMRQKTHFPQGNTRQKA